MKNSPQHIVVGPAEHGVVTYALQLCDALNVEPLCFESWQDLERALPLTLETQSVHICFTDHLLGDTPARAVQLMHRLGEQFYLSISFHDVPQVQEGEERFASRTRAYVELGERADVLVVNSEHEAAFFRRHCRKAVYPLVLPLPLAAVETQGNYRAKPLTEQPLDISVMGFLYPGKGHQELLESLNGVNANVRALGKISEGHDWLLEKLEATAQNAGVGFEVTGYLSEPELEEQMLRTQIPVCAHRHFSASGSLMKWISLGRRVLVSDNTYSRELAKIWGDFITLVPNDEWARVIKNLPVDFSQRLEAPTNWTWAHVAQGYERAWASGIFPEQDPHTLVEREPRNWPSVSVVVPYFENPDGLTAIFRALEHQDYAGKVECIVADDGSADTPPVPDNLSFPVKVVRQDNLGFRAAAVRNLGAQAASHDVLALIDGDTVPRHDYLRHAVALLAHQPHALVVGTRVHGDGKEPAWLQDAWAQTNHLAKADDSAWRFIISAVLTCSRDFFHRVGGFDESMVGYGGEDWEFAWRAWNCGARFWHSELAVADHPEDDWGKRFTDDTAAIAQKNWESVMLAQRITHPMARPSHTIFTRPDIEILIPEEAKFWQPGVLETVIEGWLALPGVHIIAPWVESAATVFTADPRVHLLKNGEAGLPGGNHGTARLRVHLLQATTVENLNDIYRVENHDGNALLTDSTGRKKFARVDSARWRSRRANASVAWVGAGRETEDASPLVASSAMVPAGGKCSTFTVEAQWTIFDEPVRLEGFFAGW